MRRQGLECPTGETKSVLFRGSLFYSPDTSNVDLFGWSKFPSKLRRLRPRGKSCRCLRIEKPTRVYGVDPKSICGHHTENSLSTLYATSHHLHLFIHPLFVIARARFPKAKPLWINPERLLGGRAGLVNFANFHFRVV